MKKIILGVIIGVAFSISGVAFAEFATALKVSKPNWQIGEKNDYVYVYKFNDGATTCYVSRTQNKTQASSIHCVK